jgi:hypothetical protein
LIRKRKRKKVTSKKEKDKELKLYKKEKHSVDVNIKINNKSNTLKFCKGTLQNSTCLHMGRVHSKMFTETHKNNCKKKSASAQVSNLSARLNQLDQVIKDAEKQKKMDTIVLWMVMARLHPDFHMNITLLAKQVNWSRPTVYKYIRKLGFDADKLVSKIKMGVL